MNGKKLLVACSVLGVLAVSLGAFGAHGLKSVLPPEKIATYTTGITYHFYHTLALVLAAILYKMSNSKWYVWSAWCFIIGILLFSGSLYLLSTRELIGLVTYKWLGPITPIGGVLFIVGWAFLGVGAYTNNGSDAAN